MRGLIIWRGNSPFNGDPIVAIMVFKSSNRKTGAMSQVYILRDDIAPLAALANGDDAAICGDCPHRRKWDSSKAAYVRSCYVNVGQSVSSVYRAYLRGAYPDASKFSPDMLRKLVRRYVPHSKLRIRWGAYGDPAMLPPAVVQQYNSMAIAHTGYTHQWRFDWATPYRGVFMASCDSFADYLQSSGAGWKTFAVVPKGAAPYSGKLCPATATDSQAQCMTCKLCDGAKTDIYVEAHGTGARYVQPVPESVAA